MHYETRFRRLPTNTNTCPEKASMPSSGRTRQAKRRCSFSCRWARRIRTPAPPKRESRLPRVLDARCRQEVTNPGPGACDCDAARRPAEDAVRHVAAEMPLHDEIAQSCLVDHGRVAIHQQPSRSNFSTRTSPPIRSAPPANRGEDLERGLC